MATCTVYGYIIDGADDPIEGVLVQFITATIPAINAVTGKAVSPSTIECTTSSTGYFSADLLVDTDFIAIINSMGIKEKIRIPAETSKNLFELIGAYVSGDHTPTDPGGEAGW